MYFIYLFNYLNAYRMQVSVSLERNHRSARTTPPLLLGLLGAYSQLRAAAIAARSLLPTASSVRPLAPRRRAIPFLDDRVLACPARVRDELCPMVVCHPRDLAGPVPLASSARLDDVGQLSRSAQSGVGLAVAQCDACHDALHPPLSGGESALFGLGQRPGLGAIQDDREDDA